MVARVKILIYMRLFGIKGVFDSRGSPLKVPSLSFPTFPAVSSMGFSPTYPFYLRRIIWLTK